MEDQAVHIAGQIGQHDLGLGALDADGPHIRLADDGSDLAKAVVPLIAQDVPPRPYRPAI